MKPQQSTDFVRTFESSLDIALYSMNVTQEKCVRWLAEAPSLVQKISEPISKQKSLESVRDKLEKLKL